jgi:dephospho-CoA kinase
VLVIGLTGGIGAGKSTVADLLGARGAHVIDVDAVGRAVLEPGADAYGGVVARFPEVVGPDGHIDRQELAARVFAPGAGPSERAALEAISHPAIEAELSRLIDDSRRRGVAVVVLDMAVLTETRLGRGLYDMVLVVEAPPEVRLARLVARGMSAQDGRARMAHQASDEQRRARADVVIVNDDDLGGLSQAVDAAWDEIFRSLAARRSDHEGDEEATR